MVTIHSSSNFFYPTDEVVPGVDLTAQIASSSQIQRPGIQIAEDARELLDLLFLDSSASVYVQGTYQ